MEVFLTVWKRPSQPPRADVVPQYFAVQESQILLTTGLDPLSANVLCDFNFIVTRRDKDNYSLLNFSRKGLDIFAIWQCSSSGGKLPGTWRKWRRGKGHRRKWGLRGASLRIRYSDLYSRQTRSPDSNPVSSLKKIGPPSTAQDSYQMRPNINQINKVFSLGESASSFQYSGKTRI